MKYEIREIYQCVMCGTWLPYKDLASITPDPWCHPCEMGEKLRSPRQDSAGEFKVSRLPRIFIEKKHWYEVTKEIIDVDGIVLPEFTLEGCSPI